MLSHTTTGPTAAGRYLVVYPIPGCSIHTVACDCATQDQADVEARRLNSMQRAREQDTQRERIACGIRGEA